MEDNNPMQNRTDEIKEILETMSKEDEPVSFGIIEIAQKWIKRIFMVYCHNVTVRNLIVVGTGDGEKNDKRPLVMLFTGDERKGHIDLINTQPRWMKWKGAEHMEMKKEMDGENTDNK